MGTVVYKYKVFVGENHTNLPHSYDILHFGEDGDGKLCFWALVNPDDALEAVEFRVYGTGWEIEENDEQFLFHMGTVVTSVGLVWHLFEVWAIPH